MNVPTWFSEALGWYFRNTVIVLFAYFIIINTWYLVLIFLAGISHARQTRRRAFDGELDLSASALSPGVSVLMPAYNEGLSIVSSVRSVLDLRYPDHELIVINDGSTDDTAAKLIAEFGLTRDLREIPDRLPLREPILAVWVTPRDATTTPLTLIDSRNSGVADSINAGLCIADKELVVMVDADSVIDPDALLKVAKPIADDPTRVVATGGVVRVVNGSTVTNGRVIKVAMPRNPLAVIQVVEYLRAFLLGRSGWSQLQGLILISGAFGMFRRDVLLDIRGLDPDSLGQDFELVMRIHRWMAKKEHRQYRVVFVPDPVSWTEVPETLGQLARQRKRWHVGLWQTLRIHRSMTFNPRYGAAGMVAVPFFWIFELAAPVIELVGFVVVPIGMLVGMVNVPVALCLLAISYLYASLITLIAIATEEATFHRYGRGRDLFTAILAAFAENVGYRQIMVFWRVSAWLGAIFGRRQPWGEQQRRGFDDGVAVQQNPLPAESEQGGQSAASVQGTPASAASAIAPQPSPQPSPHQSGARR